MTRPARWIAAVAVVAALAPTAATAQVGTTRSSLADARLAFIKTRAQAETDRRLATLDRLTVQVNAGSRFDGDHKATLLGQLSDASAGLKALNVKIQADTDVATARADALQIVTAYRVYVLVDPRTHLVLGADAEVAAVTRLTKVADKLDAAIARAEARGRDEPAAKQSLADMRAKLADAQARASGVPASVLPLTPAGWPGNKATLTSARDAVRAARADIKAAIADARSIVLST